MNSRRADWLAAFAVFVALGALAWVGWWNDLKNAHEHAVKVSEVVAASTAHQLGVLSDEALGEIDPLKAGLQDGTLMVTELRDRAAVIQNRFPAFSTIAALTPKGIVLWARTFDPIEQVARDDYPIGTNLLTLPGHTVALQDAIKLRAAVASPIFRLQEGRFAFGLFLPIFVQGELNSMLYAMVDGQQFVTEAIPKFFADTHSVVVREPQENGPGSLLYGDGAVGEGASDKTATVIDRALKVEVWPKPGLAASIDPYGDVTRLGIYLFVALLVSCTVGVALHERHLAIKEAVERKTVADSLQISQARLADIIARSPWPIIEHTQDGTVRDANPATETLFKVPPHEIRGRSILEWTYEDDRNRIRPLIADSGTAGQSFESRVVDNEGNLHYVRWSRAHRYDELGKVTGELLFGQDVTSSVEASRAQERLIAEEERVIERLWVLNDFARSLRTTLDSGSLYQIAISAATNVLANKPCAILTYDSETDMFEVSAAKAASGMMPPLPQGARFPAESTQLKGAVLEMTKAISHDLSTVRTPHEAELARHGFVSRAAVPILLDNACVGLLAAYSTESRGITRDGIEFLQGIAEHLALALTSSRLYNELKQAYNETRKAQAQIVEMEKLRAVGEMTSGIAHDFNNMLMAIIGNAEFLDEPELGEERLDHVKKILTAATDAAVTVKRLQEYSKTLPEADDFESLDISKIANDAVDLTRHKWKNQAQGRGVIIDVNKEIHPDSLRIRGNAPEIREVLTNLIFNAVDAMPEGGTITIGTGRRGNRAQIFVRDTGMGMTEEVKGKLFTPFFTTKGRQGNGLGLAMSYGIIRKHGGEIDVESYPGAGTTFTLTFPVTTEAVPEDEPPVARAAIPGLRVLVVDDDPDVAGGVAAILHKLGHSTAVAESGYAGIRHLKENHFDIVVTDLGMPGLSGREVALAAKDAAPKTAVILLTGWGETLREHDDTPPGVDLVLSKPIRSEQLDNAIRRVWHPSRTKASA